MQALASYCLKKRALLAVSASMLFGNALAGSMASVMPSDWSWVGTFSLGPVWESAGTTETFYLTPNIEKTYVANNSSQGLFDSEVFLGIQIPLIHTLQGQLGLAVAATSNAELSGVIWDDADPTFDNYTYNYNVQHTHLALKGKLLSDCGYWVTPWISASIGVGFNDSYEFNNTPLIEEEVVTPNFASSTQTAFTYTVGAGVQKALNKHWQVGVGYEFADWGQSRLGRAEDQTLNGGLFLSHLYTNGLLFNITYVS